jgi:hypothetical protein
MLERCRRDLFPFSYKSISVVGHCCWACIAEFDRVEIRALCKLVKFFHTDLDKLFLYGPCFVHRGIVMLKPEKAFPKLLPQTWKHRMV